MHARALNLQLLTASWVEVKFTRACKNTGSPHDHDPKEYRFSYVYTGKLGNNFVFVCFSGIGFSHDRTGAEKNNEKNQ
jgi:hypothetical protein